MEIVTHEVRRPRTWFFDPEDSAYVSMDKDGNVFARLNGPNLPDPNLITAELQRQAAISPNPELCRTAADPVTYELWNHWQKKQGGDNGNNN